MRIADAVHGTVELTADEAAVVSTRAYQRMRGVKHLGLASYAFPGADYSRFAHGVGTLHVTSEILRNLLRNKADSLTDGEQRLYRMAALLHDIGHYPFSHTFERALRDYYAETQLLQPAGTADPEKDERGLGEDAQGIWLHEELGTHVIEEDAELVAALAAAGIDAGELSRTITRKDPPRFANLISSDLDADRTDYLMRTAVHTGLPYGNVDLPYLLSQIRVDTNDQICFTSKGMRAAEHLLLGRYFDYQQVSYHKTVAGFELVLNDAVGVLLRHGNLSCRQSDLRSMIGTSKWFGFDDAYVTALMRDLAQSIGEGTRESLLFSSILERRPPKLLADREMLGTEAAHALTYASLEKSAGQHRQAWIDAYECPFYLWTQRGTQLTKVGSQVGVSEMANADDEVYDRLQQAVHIEVKDGSSIPIQAHTRSLMSVLSDHRLYSLRVYALLPPERERDRSTIAARVNSDLGDYFALQ